MEIRLPANFSTGYRWVLDPPVQSGHIISESYATDSTPPNAGAPGTQSFQIIFPRDGRFNLKFAYRRLWEPSSVPPARTTNLVILVTPKKSPPSMMETLFPPNTSSIVPQPEEDQSKPSSRPVELKRTR
jgi:predicted secreted protein